MDNNSQVPSEVSAAMAEMEGWRNSNPVAFEAVMKAVMESKAAGDDEETSMKKIEAALKIQQQAEIETLMAAQQVSQVANEGIELPGTNGRKVGLDGQVKQTNIPSLEITPKPCFVVKTKGVYQQQSSSSFQPSNENNKKLETKIFLNICSHEALKEPHMKKRLNENGVEVEGWNIPLAIGPLRQCYDNKNELSNVYDCIVNPQVIKSIEEEDDTGGEKDFLIQLSIQYVEQKYNCELDRRYKLPKLIYKSSNPNNSKEIASQRIKDASKQPSISEVSSSSKNQTNKSSASNKKKNKNDIDIPLELKKLKSSVWLIDVDGNEIEDETRATDTNAVSTHEAEKEPNVRYNDDNDNINDLPRMILVKIGPIGKHAMNYFNQKHFTNQNENDENKKNNENKKNDQKNDECYIDVSCYDMKVKLIGHSELHVVFPYAVVTDEVESLYKPYESILTIKIPIDPTPYDCYKNGGDPGSRPWLLAQALEGGGDGRNEIENKQSIEKELKLKKDLENYNSIEEAENRFHLRANKKKHNSNASGFDPITGLVLREEDPVDDDEILPEDKFHKDDALSTHYINQREGDKNEKWKKHEKEKKEREERKKSGNTKDIDENIEYIDVEDFSPGGRYGPPAIDVGARRDELTGVKYTQSEDMIKAANVVLSAAATSQASTSPSSLSSSKDNDAVGVSNNQVPNESSPTTKSGLTQKRLTELKSTVWADLLD